MLLYLISLYIIALVGSTLTLVQGNRLYKTYRSDYLSAYLVFLIFFTAFGFFSYIIQITAQVIVKKVPDTSGLIYKLLRFLDIFAGPLIIIALFFFILFFWRLAAKPPGKVFTITYFGAHSVFILVISIIIASKPGPVITFPLGSVAALLSIYLALGLLMKHIKDIKNKQWRKAVKILYIQYLAIFTIYFGLSFFITFDPVISFSYFGCHFVLNLPPLLYLKKHLKQFHIHWAPQLKDEEILKEIIKQHGISGREQEVLHLLLQGKSNPQIEAELFISINTVKNHVSKLYKKFGVKNRLQLTNLITNLMQ